MEKIINIPKRLSDMGELIIIPRTDYEDYLRIKKMIPLINPSAAEKKAIKEGRKQIKGGQYLNLQQLKNEVGR